MNNGKIFLQLADCSIKVYCTACRGWSKVYSIRVKVNNEGSDKINI